MKLSFSGAKVRENESSIIPCILPFVQDKNKVSARGRSAISH